MPAHEVNLHFFIGARTVDRGDFRAHRSQIGGKLAAVMDLVVQESPGPVVAPFAHDLFSVHQEWEFFVPARSGNCMEALGQGVVLFVVLREYVGDPSGAGKFDPGEGRSLEAVHKRRFFLRNQPGDFASGSRYRICAVVRAIFRNSSYDLSCGGTFFFPVPDEEFLVVHGYSLELLPLRGDE